MMTSQSPTDSQEVEEDKLILELAKGTGVSDHDT